MLLAARDIHGEIHAKQQDGATIIKPCFRCSPKIGRPETATRKQASGKFRASTTGLQMASTMKYIGADGTCNREPRSVKEQGDSVGKGAARMVDEILAYRRTGILHIPGFEPTLNLVLAETMLL